MGIFFKRSVAILAVFGSGLVATATPAMANENKSVICGWDKQDATTGFRTGYYFKNDLTAKSQSVTMTDDQWQRAQCDGADGKKGAIDRLADAIVSKYGSLDGWAKKRYETTWADRCDKSDYIAMYFGTKRNACPTFVKGQVNYAKDDWSQTTPHDLLSCMYNGRSYVVNYDGAKVTFTDVENKKSLVISELQLNCVGSPTYK